MRQKQYLMILLAMLITIPMIAQEISVRDIVVPESLIDWELAELWTEEETRYFQLEGPYSFLLILRTDDFDYQILERYALNLDRLIEQTGMMFSSVELLVDDDLSQLTIYPSFYSFDNEDLLSYFPAGIRFIIDPDLTVKYSFRMLINEYFILLQDVWRFGTSNFNDITLAAIENPYAYLNNPDARTTEQLLENLLQLEQNLIELLGELQTSLATEQ